MIEVKKIRKKDIVFKAPPAKAYTLRALLISALADGTSRISNPLLADDQIAMINCLRGLGIIIDYNKELITVTGGNGRFQPVRNELNAHESGVTMNFLTSAACLSEKEVVLTGKEGLLKSW